MGPVDNDVLHVSFCGTIDAQSVGRIAAVLGTAHANGLKEVHFALSSGGGDIASGFHLYGLIRALSLRLTIYSLGTVASVATTAFVSAHHRVACPRSAIMLHPVAPSQPGHHPASKLEFILSSALADEQRTEDVLRQHTRISEDLLRRRRLDEVWLSAKEALQEGLVDEVRDFTVPAGARFVVI